MRLAREVAGWQRGFATTVSYSGAEFAGARRVCVALAWNMKVSIVGTRIARLNGVDTEASKHS